MTAGIHEDESGHSGILVAEFAPRFAPRMRTSLVVWVRVLDTRR